MSGFVYDDAKQNNPLTETEVFLTEENSESTSVDSFSESLFADYQCQYEELDDVTSQQASELCSAIYTAGYSHNIGLFDVSISAMDLDASSTHDPEMDLMMYDRIIMNTGNIDYLRGHHNSRWITQSILENSNYSAEDSGDEKVRKTIEDGMLGNQEFCTLTPTIVSGYVDAESSQQYQDNCDSWLPLVRDMMSLTYETFQSGDNWLDTLKVSEDSNEAEKVMLPMIDALAHATMAYWGCDSTDSPDYADLPGHECFETFEEYVEMTGGRSGGGGGTPGDEPWHANIWFPFAVLLDIIGLAFVFLLMIAAGLVAIGALVVPIFDNDSSTVPDWDNVTKAFKFIMDLGPAVPTLLQSFKRHIEDTAGVTIDEGDLKIGNVSIIGPDGWVASVSDFPGGICPVEMRAKLMDSDTSYVDGDPYLQYLWMVQKVGASGGQWSSISNPNEDTTEIIFWGTGTYKISVKITSLHTSTTPVIAELTNYLIPEPCVDPDPGGPDPKPPISAWSDMMIISPNDNNLDWKEHALNDLGISTGLNWKSELCPRDMWTDECYVAATRAIHHNKFLGSTFESYKELELYTSLNSRNAINNIDAAVVSTDDPLLIALYERGGRDFSENLLIKTKEQAKISDNSGDSITLLQMKALHEMSVESEAHEDLLRFLDGIIENWNENTAERDYLKSLEIRMAEADYSELPPHVQLNYLEQKAVLHASEDVDDILGIPQWLQKLIDAASVIVGSGTMMLNYDFDLDPTDQPGYNMVQSGLGSLQAIILTDNSGTHVGFADTDACAGEVSVSDCTISRLEANQDFASERASAAANPSTTCGENPSITTLANSVSPSYSFGSNVDFTITAECTINGFVYNMKTIVSDSSTGVVVHQFKTSEPWEEKDNSEEFQFSIPNLVNGTYCVESTLLEEFNPNAVDTDSTCFDVAASEEDDDDNDDEGWWSRNIPGFTGMTAFIAMLGAAIIAFRRLEDQ